MRWLNIDIVMVERLQLVWLLVRGAVRWTEALRDTGWNQHDDSEMENVDCAYTDLGMSRIALMALSWS